MFYDQVLAAGAVWTLVTDDGAPVRLPVDGGTAVPFWSSPSRLARARRGLPGARPLALVLDAFREAWLPGLAQDGLLAQVNGDALDPQVVLAVLQARAGGSSAARDRAAGS